MALTNQGAVLDYEYTVSGKGASAFAALADELTRQGDVLGFRISPSLD